MFFTSEREGKETERERDRNYGDANRTHSPGMLDQYYTSQEKKKIVIPSSTGGVGGVSSLSERDRKKEINKYLCGYWWRLLTLREKERESERDRKKRDNLPLLVVLRVELKVSPHSLREKER